MGAIRYRCAKALAIIAILGAVSLGGAGLGVESAWAEPIEDRPVVWHEDDRRDIPEPEERDPGLVWSAAKETVKRPGLKLLDTARWVRRAGTVFGGDHVVAAHNVNTLDEVPNSSWFTNRIGLFPLNPEDVARGPGDGSGPSRSGPWTVIGAKTEGVTPGFNIRDAQGDIYVIKFDSPEFPNMASAAGVISGRLLHAAGYHVPDDAVVYFRRDELVVGEDAKIRPHGESKRPMTESDLEAILARVRQESDGSWRAVSSRFLSGKPLGPFDYKGTRSDDPNDRIPHQHRRELRGLRMFAAWIHHFDTKEQNSLDMFVEEDGRHFVRHNLIDFASTLGAGANGPARMYGWEMSFDTPAIFGRWFGLGLRRDLWRALERPEGLSEVGYFESVIFDPLEFKPMVPNSAFANLTDRDGYWAAKTISAFRDEHLRAVAEEGKYEDPRAAQHVARVLGERRDKIARLFFDRIAPLEYFAWRGEEIRFRDLGAERGIYPRETTRYRVRARFTDAEGQGPAWSTWQEIETSRFTLGDRTVTTDPGRFLWVEARVSRGGGWSDPVSAVFSPTSHAVISMAR